MLLDEARSSRAPAAPAFLIAGAPQAVVSWVYLGAEGACLRGPLWAVHEFETLQERHLGKVLGLLE